MYDFVDSWEHWVVVEDTLSIEANATYPRCDAGRRAAPPEDVGGAWGYAESLAVLADPRHEEHAERVKWVGGGFDSESCDLADINEALRPVPR